MTSPKLIYNGKGFAPADPEELQRFKDGLQPGAAFRLESWEERRADGAMRLAYKLIDRYVHHSGQNKEESKYLLKRRHGVYVPIRTVKDIPEWSGQAVDEVDGLFFYKSLRDYTTPEMTQFIDGTLRDLSTIFNDSCSDILREAT